jgi:hypothetical protein
MENLYITYNKNNSLGDLYTVSRGSVSYTAFQTHTAFINWVALHELTLSLVSNGKGFAHYRVMKKSIEEKYILSIDQIPSGCVPIHHLCNGQYIRSYLQITEEMNTIYVPAPGSDLYLPLNYWDCESMVCEGVYIIP